MEPNNHNYASLAKRTLAAGCDLSLHTLIAATGFYFVCVQPTIKDTLIAFFLYLTLIILNPFLLYHSIICLPLFGGSIGKLATGLRVVTIHNHYLSFKHAFFRQTVGYQFSAILLGLGFLAIKKHPERQAWHDQAIDSHVVVFHPYWFLGVLVILSSLFLSGLLLFKGITTFMQGPVPPEYMMMYGSPPAEHESSMEATDDNFYTLPKEI